MKSNSVFKACAMLLLVLITVLTCTVPATAKEVIGFEEVVAAQGESISYAIKIEEGSDICGLSLEIKYQPDQVKLNSCTVGSILDSGLAKSNTNISGKVILSYISVSPLTASGVLITLDFSPLSTTNKKIDIVCTVTECIDTKCTEVAYTYSKCDITNPNYAAGSEQADPTTPESTEQTSPDSAAAGDSTQLTHEKPSENESEPISGAATEATEPTLESPEETSDDADNSPVSVTPAEGTEETATSLSGSQASPTSKTGLIIAICIGVIVLTVIVCAVLVKNKISKRRNGNEKN